MLMPRILGPNLRKRSGMGMKRTVMRARMRPAKRGLRAVYIWFAKRGKANPKSDRMTVVAARAVAAAKR